MWSEEYWVFAKCICFCVGILGLVLTDLGTMTARAAFAPSIFAVIYVLLATYLGTRRSKEPINET
jgi:hypothetical protein